MPRAVIAVGGNSLIVSPDRSTVEDQYAAAKETAEHIATLIVEGWEVALVHGNGPQVGFILQRSEFAHSQLKLHEVPLDVCGADTQGAIGYAFQQNLQNEFFDRGVSHPVVTVVTQVVVDMRDPAMSNPTKPIGQFMDEQTALRRRDRDGWQVVEDAGRGWRRVVPSPRPIRLVEQGTIEQLLNMGTTVIAAGGGGIPVIEDSAGHLRGTAAVVDKDLSAAMLAKNVGADVLLISTGVEKVCLSFRTPEQREVDTMTVAEAEAYWADGKHFASGSMAPKIEAAIDFLRGGGKRVIITNPQNIERAVHGETGTHIVP